MNFPFKWLSNPRDSCGIRRKSGVASLCSTSSPQVCLPSPLWLLSHTPLENSRWWIRGSLRRGHAFLRQEDPSLNESEAETLSDTLSDPRAEPHSLQPGEPSGCWSRRYSGRAAQSALLPEAAAKLIYVPAAHENPNALARLIFVNCSSSHWDSLQLEAGFIYHTAHLKYSQT